MISVRIFNKQSRFRSTSIIILFLIVFSGVIYYFWFYSPPPECKAIIKEVTNSAMLAKLPTISKEELLSHNGLQDPTIYIGLDCLVYDVTAGKEQYYGEGKPYHYLVARDATTQLKIFGGDIIKEKYPIVGILGD